MVLGLILYEVSVVGGGVNGFLGSIFYWHSVVGNNTYYMCTKMGGTLPVLKNEIEDFFFARLGTGRTYHCSLRHNVCRPATDAYTDTNNNKKRTGVTGSKISTVICEGFSMRNG